MKIAILGAGPGGYVAALRSAQLGGKVTVIERSEVGGTCLNWGCIPTKTLIASSEAYAKAKELSSFGIDLNGTLSPNMEKIIERKNKVVSTQVKGVRSLFKSWDITLIEGKGTFVSQNEISVARKDGSEEAVTADAFIIATGSRPAEIETCPFDGKNILSSTEALDLKEIPKSLLIVGAGVIGSEFACIYSELGTEVTMVELLPRAVSTEDEAVSKLLEREFKKKRIRLFTNVNVERIDVHGDGVHSFLSSGEEIITDKVLVSIGRLFNTEDIGIEHTGVQGGKRNEILVNAKLQTNIPYIYSIGDVTGGILLAHVASHQGILAADNIMGADRKIDYSVVPAAIFTSPEIASVGLREHQVAEKDIPYSTGEFQFRALGKAHAMGEISGFIKIIAEKDTDLILGAHIIGPHASDLVHQFALAMRTGLKVSDVAETIHAHPTISEGVMEAAADVHNLAIHVPRK